MSDMALSQVNAIPVVGGAAVSQVRYDVISSFCPLDNNIDPDENFLLGSCKPMTYWLPSDFNKYIKKVNLITTTFLFYI